MTPGVLWPTEYRRRRGLRNKSTAVSLTAEVLDEGFEFALDVGVSGPLDRAPREQGRATGAYFTSTDSDAVAVMPPADATASTV
jgi:hypothetical protein